MLRSQIRNSGVGTMMEVNWEGQWYSAQVQKLDRRERLIHNVSYDDAWDEVGQYQKNSDTL